jgi:tyrosyl-tRNA synthetase
MQAYDSVAINADVELGGTDQKFNILMGRTIQKEYNQSTQIAIFMPILEGLDGEKKMSKSLGNYIGINEDPKEIYGKAMSLPDGMILRYFELVTDLHPDDLDEIREGLKDGVLNPRDVKMRLAREIVALYHGEEKSIDAEEYFIRVFQKKSMPEEIEEKFIPAGELRNGTIFLPRLLTLCGLAPTTSEAKRLITQGAVKINENKILIPSDYELKDDDIVQVGKRKFVKIVIDYSQSLRSF